MKNLLFGLAAFISGYSNAQTVIPLCKGAAPASENWNWNEKQIKADIGTTTMDVSHPAN